MDELANIALLCLLMGAGVAVLAIGLTIAVAILLGDDK